METRFTDIKAKEEHLLCRSYARYPLALVRGKMSHVWDQDGKEYVDLLAGIAVCALGHCNDEVTQTLIEQAHKLWHVSNLFYQEEQLDLAQRLLRTSHHDRVFFCNSGAEANEAQIKLARRYMRTIQKRDAYEIITLTGCFHGRTLGTLAATNRENLIDGFTPLPEGFAMVAANNINALEARITSKTAAVLLEVIQGEGGIIPLDPNYLKNVQELCRAKHILFLCDEVQAGLCRSGAFWAFQNHDLKPDIISCAKGLANGLPMGAILATEEVSQGFVAGSHATTFGGGALTAKVAEKVIEIMERDELAKRAGRVGLRLLTHLTSLQQRYPERITAIRGQGLMVGIDVTDCPTVWKKLLHAGFITGLTHNQTLRLLPALPIDEDDLLAFVKALETILAA
ncbi:MAG: aspartate aminotransferase family protein [Desulfovibrio sp.]|nr:aspartate aminotransferase family protein [Desulfovibrio sp.]